jgi:hypothetical protein
MKEIIFSALALFFGLTIIVFPFFSYRKKMEKYSHLAFFPCEIPTTQIERYIFTVVTLAFSLFCDVVYIDFFSLYSSPVFISSMILLLISQVSIIVVYCYTLLDSPRIHIIFAAIMISTTIFGNTLTAIPYFNEVDRYPLYIPSVLLVFGVFGLVLLLFVFNPQLKDWAKLDKVEEDGKIQYIRKRVNPLGIIEWGTLCVHMVNMLLVLINAILGRY